MLMYFSAILVLPIQIVLKNRLHLCQKNHDFVLYFVKLKH